MRRDYGIEGGIPVVFSLEKPKAKLLPFKGPSGEEENPSDYQVHTLLANLNYMLLLSITNIFCLQGPVRHAKIIKFIVLNFDNFSYASSQGIEPMIMQLNFWNF